ncbi:MAG: class I SAM-dependent methyltransferase [Ignavibacteriales bacterium]|nr:class I SAM-dependent methyltransferase [Ignavibacteriales bacterium]
MDIKDAYKNWSSSYDVDRNLTRDLDERVTRDILKNLRCKSIIEIGCGTGKNTSFLAQIGEKVHAIDFSEGMINKAKDKLQLQNVTFSIADITNRWHIRDRSADLIVCNLVLEHVENLPSIFSEAYRTLVDKGHLFICELHPFRQYQGTKASFQRDQGITEIQAFVHNISDFLDAAEINSFILESFKEWWHEDDKNKLPRLASFIFVK